jgi:hypothetical protein
MNIEFQFIETNKVLDEPEFTKDGLYIPASYFEIYERYHSAVIDTLETLKFLDLLNLASNLEVGPACGFAVWIREATLISWVLSLKKGVSHRSFYPATVAKGIVEVTQVMLAEDMLKNMPVDALRLH